MSFKDADQAKLVEAVVTALAQLEMDKRAAFWAARDADTIESKDRFVSRWDRTKASGELHAAIEARGAVGVALIQSGVNLDNIREIEASVDLHAPFNHERVGQ